MKENILINKNFLYFSSLLLIPIIISILYTFNKESLIYVLLALITFLYFTKNMFLSNSFLQNQFRIFSISGFMIITFTYDRWHSLQELLINIFSLKSPIYDNISKIFNINETSYTLIIILSLYCILISILNYKYSREKTIIKEHPDKITNILSEHKLDLFCNGLKSELHIINRSTDWNNSFFIPLEAEVEIKDNSSQEREIILLNNAIRKNNKDNIFLLLGDPGSGKSTSLRKLSEDLLNEVIKTNKIPIYINLKEWNNTKNWNTKNPPTEEELKNFIKQNLKERLSSHSLSKIIDEDFDMLHENGHFFIILDSFDEIPAILDEEESSWLINELSIVIYKFLTFGKKSTGLLSSRFFRKPSEGFHKHISYEIRPLNDNKIIEILEKRNFNNNLNVTEIFKSNPELFSLARNPFTAVLICSFIENNSFIPEKQIKLYEDFLKKKLDNIPSMPDRKKLPTNLIIQSAQEIAKVMFENSNYGLEIPVKEVIKILEKKFNKNDVPNIIDSLSQSKLIRIGNGYNRLLSFVHRRFHEYFIAITLIDKKLPLPDLEAIPKDSKWRDSLVLYCELASKKEAKYIANFCWEEIKELQNDAHSLGSEQYRRSIHCLRFLKEAFRSRQNCLEDFESKIKSFIITQTSSKKCILDKKFAVEAIGLLKDEDIDEVIINALNIKNYWIKEESFKACRHLPQISNELSNKVKHYLNSINLIYFFLNRKSIIFSLKISNAFETIGSLAKIKVISIYLTFLGLTIMTLFAPLFTLVFFGSFYSLFSILKFLGFQNKNMYKKDIEFLLFIYSTFAFLILHSQNKISETLFSLSFLEITNDIYYIYLIAIILIFPWYELYTILLRISNIIRSLTKEKVISFIKYGALILLGLVFVIICLLLTTKIIVKYNFISTVMASTLIISSILFLIYLRIHDYFLFTNEIYPEEIERKTISKTLKKFKTVWGERKYIHRLDRSRSEFIEEWPDQVEYRCKDEHNETILAQLDEKWFNLN